MKNDDDLDIGIYLSLDDLFDTKRTLLGMLNIDEALKNFNGDYDKRKRDSFGFIDMHNFGRIFERRTIELVKLSKPNGILDTLQKYITGTTVDMVREGRNANHVVYINVYPYELTDAEQVDIRKVLMVYFPVVTNIQIMRQENITPNWINNNVSLVVMHDGLKWLNYNNAIGNFNAVSLLDLEFIIPKLINELVESDEDDFKQYTELFGMLCNITFMPVGVFSIK